MPASARDGAKATPAARPFSAIHFGALFGSAIVLGHVGQFAWLIAGSRAMSVDAFGAVLSAQALYGALQLIVDTGSGFYGARLAASDALDDEARGSLIRLRLQLSAVFAAVAVAVGALSGGRSLSAGAPFAVALVLFALLNYWEAFGRGNGRPWSAYVVLRAVAPAAVVIVFLAADRTFPVFLAGTIECAVLVAVAVAFRLELPRSMVLALAAGRGPWRRVVSVGLPPLLLQAALACGPVMTNAAGRASTAAALAVSARVLTGLNQLSGLVSTSLFPRIARGGAVAGAAPDRRGVSLGLRVILVVTLAANAVLIARPSFFVALLLAHRDSEAQATSVLTVGAAATVGYLTFLAMLLVAYHEERLAIVPFAVGTAVTAVGGIAIAAHPPMDAGAWMAGVFAAAQSLVVLLLVRRRSAVLAPIRRVVLAGAAGAAGLTAVAAVSATVPAARPPSAVLLGVCAVALASATIRSRRRVARG